MESFSSHAAASPSLSDNWSERVEDLVDAGDIDAAIALQSPRLDDGTAELSKLYSVQGLSSKPTLSNHAPPQPPPPPSMMMIREARVSGDVDRPRNSAVGDSEGVDGVNGGDSKLSTNRVVDNAVEGTVDDYDDWGTAAEHAVNEFLGPHNSVGVSKPAPEVSTSNIPKRRGRGTFSYQKRGLYSDEHYDASNLYSQKDDKVDDEFEKTDATNCMRLSSNIEIFSVASLRGAMAVNMF
ncbi:hypothetical protein AKJ16_DCAP18385 [Drosera capensis]